MRKQKGLPTLIVLVCLFSLNLVTGIQNAFAGTAYVVNIVASGGAAEGSGWGYSSNVITPTSNVSINASDVVSKLALGPLEINSDTLTVSTSITYSNSNSLTLKSTYLTVINGGVTIQSQGGDLIFIGDSDSNGVGNIRLGSPTSAAGSVNSNGGKIVFSGGANPDTGFAMANVADIPASKWASGFSSWGFAINAAGGNVLIRASTQSTGSYQTRPLTLDAGASGANSSITTSGSGTVTLFTDGSQISSATAWGVIIVSTSITTGSGEINISGSGMTGGSHSNVRGVIFSGASSVQSNNGGNIYIADLTNGSGVGYTGLYSGGTLGISTSGNVLIESDKFQFDAALSVSCNQMTLQSRSTNSFIAGMDLKNIQPSNCKSFIYGKSGNTSAASITTAMSIGGPATFNAGSLNIANSLTAVDSLFTFNISGSITQTAALNGKLTLAAGGSTARLRQVTTLTATVPNVPGRTTFYANNKKIGACIALPTSGGSVSCNWKPSTRNAIRLTAIFKPTGGGTLSNSSSPVPVSVIARTGTR